MAKSQVLDTAVERITGRQLVSSSPVRQPEYSARIEQCLEAFVELLFFLVEPAAGVGDTLLSSGAKGVGLRAERRGALVDDAVDLGPNTRFSLGQFLTADGAQSLSKQAIEI